MDNFEKYIEAMKKDREIPANVEQKWQETILAIRQTADEQKNKDHSAEITTTTTEITAERKEVNIIMKTFKNIAVACACLVAVFGISVGTAKVNPTFADAMSNVPIIGNVFENLRQNENVTLEGADGEQYPVIKENHVDYNVLEKEARKPEIEDVTTVENNGLTLTIDNYLCDGDNMVINFTAVNNNPNVENATVLWGDAYTLIDGKCIDLATGIQMVQSTETPNLYTGTMSFPLTYTPEGSSMTYFSISEKTPLEITFRNLTMDVPFGKDENKDFGSFPGPYKLSLGVTPDSETKKYDINYTDEATGIEIKSVTKSKLETKVEYTLPWKYSDFNDAETIDIFASDGTLEGSGPKYSIIMQGYDENGNLISGSGYGGKAIFVDKDGNQYDPYAEDFAGNDGLTEIKTGGFTTTEAKSITLKVVNKQEQDENGNMKVLFEYTVPLD